MKFGVCCGLEEALLALEIGYDYVELGAAAIATADDLTPYRALPIEATNLFFPSSIQLFGPQPKAYLDYAPKAIEKVASLGVKVMVVGSGGARKAPEGVAEDVAEALFLGVVRDLQEIADIYGVHIAPESLNRSETNVGNDLGELAHRLQAVGVGYTADLYHILYEASADGAEPDLNAQVPYVPTHVHLADLPRNAPSADDVQVAAFARRLHALGYNARISLECTRPNPAKDLAKGLATMKALFNF